MIHDMARAATLSEMEFPTSVSSAKLDRLRDKGRIATLGFATDTNDRKRNLDWRELNVLKFGVPRVTQKGTDPNVLIQSIHTNHKRLPISLPFARRHLNL